MGVSLFNTGLHSVFCFLVLIVVQAMVISHHCSSVLISLAPSLLTFLPVFGWRLIGVLPLGMQLTR